MKAKFAIATTLSLALTACGGGGGGGGGSVGGASGSNVLYDDIQELTGQANFSYTLGGVAFNEEVTYGITAVEPDSGITYRHARARVSSSALSDTSIFDPVVCASWAELNNAFNYNQEAENALGGSYVCSYFFPSGSSAWYAVRVSPTSNVISGSFAFASAESGENGFVRLVRTPDAVLNGRLNPSRTRTADNAANDASLEVLESLFGAIQPAPRNSDEPSGRQSGFFEEIQEALGK